MALNVLKDQSLESMNTFGISCKSRFFVSISHEEQLKELFLDSRYTSMDKFCLGGGSNILFRGDFSGLIFQNNIQGFELLDEDDHSVLLKVGAGVPWQDFMDKALSCQWAGIENLNLIPGRVGAAPIQNIGAYGVEVRSVIDSVEIFNPSTLQQEVLSNAECGFGYRHSIFKTPEGRSWVVTHVKFRLRKNGKVQLGYRALKEALEASSIKDPTIHDVARVVAEIRRSKLPDPHVLGNAGSFFKNPKITGAQRDSLRVRFPDLISYAEPDGHFKLPAGWLIEKAGLKGYRKGAAGVHQQQALVLVNHGGATGEDVLALAGYVQEVVAKQFGVNLEREVNVIPAAEK